MSEATKVAELPKLQVPCHTCDGAGHLRADGGRWRECPTCGGQGYFATDFGEQVIDLVRRNLWKIQPEN